LVGLETITTTSTNFPFFVHGSENKAIETAGGFYGGDGQDSEEPGFFSIHVYLFIF
jgi:hypothetical protein